MRFEPDETLKETLMQVNGKLPSHSYIPNSALEIQARMLAAIGISDVDELFAAIPKDLRSRSQLNIPAAVPFESVPCCLLAGSSLTLIQRQRFGHRPCKPAMAVNYAVSVGLLGEPALKDGPVDCVQLNIIGRCGAR
jgi:hypothetical protein